MHVRLLARIDAAAQYAHADDILCTYAQRTRNQLYQRAFRLVESSPCNFMQIERAGDVDTLITAVLLHGFGRMGTGDDARHPRPVQVVSAAGASISTASPVTCRPGCPVACIVEASMHAQSTPPRCTWHRRASPIPRTVRENARKAASSRGSDSARTASSSRSFAARSTAWATSGSSMPHVNSIHVRGCRASARWRRYGSESCAAMCGRKSIERIARLDQTRCVERRDTRNPVAAKRDLTVFAYAVRGQCAFRAHLVQSRKGAESVANGPKTGVIGSTGNPCGSRCASSEPPTATTTLAHSTADVSANATRHPEAHCSMRTARFPHTSRTPARCAERRNASMTDVDLLAWGYRRPQSPRAAAARSFPRTQSHLQANMR